MKLVSAINTRGTLVAKRNRVDEEVRDVTFFGQKYSKHVVFVVFEK